MNNWLKLKQILEQYMPQIIQEAKKELKYYPEYDFIAKNQEYVYYHMNGEKNKRYIGDNAPLLQDDNIQDVIVSIMFSVNGRYERKIVEQYLKNNPNALNYLSSLLNNIKEQLNQCVILPKDFVEYLNHKNISQYKCNKNHFYSAMFVFYYNKG